MVTTKWLASLSDGTTAVEGEGEFIRDGVVPMWHKLLKHLEENDLTITGFRVQVSKDGEPTKTYNLPSHSIEKDTGKHEKWKYLTPMIPLEYNCRRAITRAIMTGEQSIEIEITAKYEDFSVSLFVDQDEGNESWVVIHKNK